MKNLPAYFQQQQQFTKINKLFNNNQEEVLDEQQTKHQNIVSKKISSPVQNLQYLESKNENIKVMVRIRPPLIRELKNEETFVSTLQVSPNKKQVVLYEYHNIEMVGAEQIEEFLEDKNNYTLTNFQFDCIYDQDATQEQVYEQTAQPALMSVLQGFNATIMAYGQTGTGKTYTMEGFIYNTKDQGRGIVPRCIEQIFMYIENLSNSQQKFMVRVSYLQIYNDNISDLLRAERQSLQIREDKKKGIYVENLSEWAVRTPNEVYRLIEKGANNRATAETKLNDVSSRSHAIFQIIIEQMTISNDYQEQKQIKVGKLNLVDLAGSERIRVTGATGMRLEECKKINSSLSALGNVISALSENKGPREHIPYRNSKLTRILEDSLGGNCKTTFMAMVSPSVDSFNETSSTLKFSSRVKNIKNLPIINQDQDQKTLIRKYEQELRRLKSELEERNKNIIDKSKMHQLEEEKRKAEQDKFAAMAALERRSREFFLERDEKRKLEEKIRSMDSQVLIGGRKIEDTPQFRNALQEQQKIIREQYENRLQELEKEREQIEEDKAQVDRYKQLLLKQRDIMIALTTRLNERDETIIQLQEELDAYDRIHKETEDMLEAKNSRVFLLENYLRNNNITVPPEQQQQQDNNIHIPNNTNDLQADVIRYKQIIQQQNEQIQRLNISISNNNNEYVNQLEQEKENLEELLKQYHNKQQEMEEYIQYKDQEIQQLINSTKISNSSQFQQSQSNPQNSKIISEVKKQVDQIIDILSQQPNDQYKLQNVAKQLLSLQRLVRNSVQQ